MDTRKFIEMTIIAIVGILLITTALIPVISSLPGNMEERTNEGSALVNMTKIAGNASATIEFTGGYDENTDSYDLYVLNGTDRQDIDLTGNLTGIIYADSNLCITLIQGSLTIAALGENPVVMGELGIPTTITKTSSGVTVASESAMFSQTFSNPEWAYVPLSTGKFSTYLDGTDVNTDGNFTKVFYGMNNEARVACYNDMNSSGAEMTFLEDYSEGVLSGGDWSTNDNPPVVVDVNMFIAPNTYYVEGSSASPVSALLFAIPLLLLVGIVLMIIRSVGLKQE